MTDASIDSTEPETSVVVIGAGQAGLSVSYYLKRLGLDAGNEFVVLDRGPGTGGAWQHRWDALRIGSAHRINDLPGMDVLGLSFDTADRSLPAKDVVADYYEQYEKHYEFQIVRPAAVTKVENEGKHLLVRFNDGQGEQTVSTDIVINATGTWGAPFVPYYPGSASFLGRQLHTNEYTDATEFAGKKVLVVGGGTSAIGFLLELENIVGETIWATRRPIDFLEDGELNLENRTSAVQMQDEAARAGKALPSIVSGTGVPRTRRIQAGIERGVLNALPMFKSIEPNGVRWEDGTFREVDVIIWSTGFRPELRHLAPLKLREKEGGIVVAAGTAWKDPRIFFAGYGPQASTIGANRAGRTIARQVVATMSRMKRLEREAREEAELREREAADPTFDPFYNYVLPGDAEQLKSEPVDLGPVWDAPVAASEEPEAEAEAEAVQDAVTESSEPVAAEDDNSDLDADPVAEAEPEIETDAHVESDRAIEPAPEPESEVESIPEPEVEPIPEPEIEPEIEPDREPGPVEFPRPVSALPLTIDELLHDSQPATAVPTVWPGLAPMIINIPAWPLEEPDAVAEADVPDDRDGAPEPSAR